MVSSKLENGILTIYIEGKIDTVSSPEIEAGIDAEKEGKTFEEVVVDFGKVQYISSSGLRVILRLKKAAANVSIVNVSSDVYSVFEMTGFTEMMKIEKALRQISIEGCKEIGHGAKGVVYRYTPDTIVKVYREATDIDAATKERELARKAFVLGVPTAISFDIVKVGDSYASMFELLDCRSLTEEINDAQSEGDEKRFDEYVSVYANLLRGIHEIEVDNSIPDRKEKMYERLENAKEFLKEEYDTIKKLIDDVPVSNTLLHCDCHTNNVMMMGGEALLIDMDTLSRGNICFELTDIYTAYVAFGESDPSIVERFMGVDYKLAKKIWNTFLPKYFATDDKEFLEEQENKIKLLSYLRIINHYVRRNDKDSDVAKRAIEEAERNIKDLTTKVFSLTI